MALKDIPRPSSLIDIAIRRILEPLVDAVQTRLVGQPNRQGEKAVTRDELVRLGLVTQAQLDGLNN